MKTLNPDYITYQGVSIFKKPQGVTPYVSALSHPKGEETSELAKQTVDSFLEGKAGKPVIKHAIMWRYIGSPLNPVELVLIPGSEEVYTTNGHNCSTDNLQRLAEKNKFYEATPENLEKVRVLHFSTEPDQIMDLAAQFEQEMESSKIDVIQLMAS